MTCSARVLPLAFLLVLVGCDGRAEPPPKVDFTEYLQKHSPDLELRGYVTDAADILSPEQEASLTRKLQELERRTKRQMVIVTSPSLGGRDIAAYTRDLGNRWGIGRKGYDDGVMLLVAPNERQVRIAVGRGLERRLTPELLKTIIDSDMIPRFRDKDHAGALDAGVDRLMPLLK